MPKGRLPKRKSDYYLPKAQFRMVQYFCYSYGDMRREILSMSSLKSPVIDDMPHATGTSNPTERDGMRLAELNRKCRIIEDAVREVCPQGMEWMFRAVTDEKITYQELRDKYGFPYGHNLYSRMKAKIYWKVAKEI